jgi:hypothetical protein
VAVPSTPLRVAPPSAAACDAEESLHNQLGDQEKASLRLIGRSLDDGCSIEHSVDQLSRQPNAITTRHRTYMYNAIINDNICPDETSDPTRSKKICSGAVSRISKSMACRGNEISPSFEGR